MKYKLLIVLILVFTSCKFNRVIEPKINDAFNVKINLDFSILSINIHDRRENVSSEDIKIPFINYSNDIRTNVPAIKATHDSIIKTTIKERVTGIGKKAHIDVYLISSYKEYKSTFWENHEKAYTKLMIRFSDSAYQKYFTTEASSKMDYTSGSGKEKRFEKIYLMNLKSTVIHCLKGMRDGRMRL